MISAPTTIVTIKTPTIYRHRCLWKIYDAEGHCYTTQDIWLAALAKRFHEKRLLVTVQSREGWYYRDLQNLCPVLESISGDDHHV